VLPLAGDSFRLWRRDTDLSRFTYVTTRAIYGVHFQFEQEKFQVIDAAAFARGDPRRFALVTVIDDRRIELPL
jgi:hypothetical protein